MQKLSNWFNIVCLIIILMALNSCAATLIGAGVGTAVASSTDTRGIGTVVTDQDLEHKVNAVLAAQIPSGSFTVASYANRVLIAGQVANENDYNKIHDAVMQVVGVTKVWNYVEVTQNETIADISKDTYITSVAKSRLILQKQVNANNIKVVTCAGVVYLLGNNAGTRYQIQGAIQAIKQISGVHGVVNLISFN